MSAGRDQKAALWALRQTLSAVTTTVDAGVDSVYDIAVDHFARRFEPLVEGRGVEWTAAVAHVVEAADAAMEAIVKVVVKEQYEVDRALESPLTPRLPWRESWIWEPERRGALTSFLENWVTTNVEGLSVLGVGNSNAVVPLIFTDAEAVVRIRLNRELDDPAMFYGTDISSLVARHANTDHASIRLGLSDRFAIHTHAPGMPLSVSHPEGTPLPDYVITEDLRLHAAMRGIQRGQLERRAPNRWMPSTTEAFYTWYRDYFRGLRESGGAMYPGVYEDLHVPMDPWQRGDGLEWSSPAPRRLCLIHGDLSRGNRVFTDGAGRKTYVDLDLAAWADPLFEVVRNIYLSGHEPDQVRSYLDGWEATTSPEYTIGWQQDYDDVLRTCEGASGVIDPLRAARNWRHSSAQQRHVAAAQVANRLNALYPIWEPGFSISEVEVATALNRHAMKPRRTE